jgi:hypothetical protein
MRSRHYWTCWKPQYPDAPGSAIVTVSDEWKQAERIGATIVLFEIWVER